MTKVFLQDQRARQRFVDAASRFAEAERSDPFAFNRAAAHARVGLLDGDEYDAEVYMERRAFVANGRRIEYTVPAYRSVTRA
jgi:hypothetical protein